MNRKAVKKNTEIANAALNLGGVLTVEELIIPATRYYLGRRTIAAVCHAQALALHWYEIPERLRVILRRDIEEVIKLDDEARARYEARSSGANDKHDEGCRSFSFETLSYPLGDDCDRDAWCSVQKAWTNPPSVSMEGVPMGDPHPCDLTRAGQHPVTGKPVDTAVRPWQNGDTWHCRCGAANMGEKCTNCKRLRADEWGDVPPRT